MSASEPNLIAPQPVHSTLSEALLAEFNRVEEAKLRNEPTLPTVIFNTQVQVSQTPYSPNINAEIIHIEPMSAVAILALVVLFPLGARIGITKEGLLTVQASIFSGIERWWKEQNGDQ